MAVRVNPCACIKKSYRGELSDYDQLRSYR